MENKHPKRVTLRQLAHACNLSAPTVSRVLKGQDTYCTEKTKELVRRTAQELGYVPNIGYKLMHGIKTKTIAIVSGYPGMFGYEYIQKVILLLTDYLGERGYFVYIMKMPEDWGRRGEVMRTALERGVEQFSCLGKPCELEELEPIAKRVSVVSMGEEIPFVSSVSIDVEYGVTQLLTHFRSTGCRHIKAITKEEPCRLRAFSAFFGRIADRHSPDLLMLSADEDIRKPENIHDAELAMEAGYRKTEELLARYPETDAILYYTDHNALGGAKYLLEQGRMPGKDIRIAGYNNTTAVRCCPCPISSVGQNEEETVQTLLKLREEKEIRHIVLKPGIYIRD